MAESQQVTEVCVAHEGELPVGRMKRVVVEGEAIVLIHLDDGYYALQDACTHSRASLSEGTLEGDVLQCPKHGGRFFVKTGKPARLPVVRPARRFPVRVEGDEVLLSYTK